MNTQLLLAQLEDTLGDENERSYFRIHSVRYKKTIDQVEKLSAGKTLTILDIGCFPYHVGWMLEKMGHTVFGISSEHEPVKRKNVSVMNIEKDRLPFKDSTFDLILCNEVIEHLPNSPVFALREMKRVAKTDGCLMITTPNVTRLINRLKLIFGKSINYSLDAYFENGGKGNNMYHRHNREYTLAELCTIISRAGWNIQEGGYFISYTPFRKQEKAESIFIKLGKIVYYYLLFFPSFQDTLYIVAKKL